MPEASDEIQNKPLPPLQVVEGGLQISLEHQPTGSYLPELSSLPGDLFSVAHSIPGRLRLRVPGIKKEHKLAQQITGALVHMAGVEGVRVNRLAGSVLITYAPDTTDEHRLVNALRTTDLSQITPVEVPETPIRRVGALLEHAIDFVERIAPPPVQFAAGAVSFVAALLQLPFAGTLACVASLPILCRATETLVREHRISVDGLDGMAAMMMIGYRNFRAATFMITLIGLGEYIRELTANRCKKIIDDLLGLAGRSAWLVQGKKRVCIPAEQVKLGDVVVVYPGEMIPVDGLVVKGEALVNQASLTGESAPIEARKGTRVYAATTAVQGQIYIECTAILSDSRAHKVIDLVNAAPIHETKIQNYAAHMADKAVVPIISSALLTFVLTRNVTRMMSMLIYDFSTGIRISAPTAVLSSMARAGKHGILIKSGGALERLARTDAIIFDKTGTLTSGRPHVTEVFAAGSYSQEEVITLAAAVETRLSHPAAQAIVQYAAKQGYTIPSRAEASHSMGMGVAATVNDKRVLVGSRRLMESKMVDLSAADRFEKASALRGDSLAYVAINGELGGLIGYSDTTRGEAAEMIKKLHRRGVKKIIMATGDNESSARRIANELGLDEVFSGAFPEHKADLVLQLKEQGYTVAVAGDGINDSPALAHADVAISLKGGTDAAREHADVVLTDDDLLRLPEAIDIARGSMNLVRQTMALVAIPNGAGLALTAAGIVGPAGATVLNNGSAIVAALNSLRPIMFSGYTKIREIPSP